MLILDTFSSEMLFLRFFCLCNLQLEQFSFLYIQNLQNDCSHISHIEDVWPRVAQSVTCLATDVCLTADPGVASSIQARYHTFMEIDHEIISTVILLPSAYLFKKGCCHLQAKVCAQITG